MKRARLGLRRSSRHGSRELLILVLSQCENLQETLPPKKLHGLCPPSFPCTDDNVDLLPLVALLTLDRIPAIDRPVKLLPRFREDVFSSEPPVSVPPAPPCVPPAPLADPTLHNPPTPPLLPPPPPPLLPPYPPHHLHLHLLFPHHPHLSWTMEATPVTDSVGTSTAAAAAVV
jgi:hypothetical protein